MTQPGDARPDQPTADQPTADQPMPEQAPAGSDGAPAGDPAGPAGAGAAGGEVQSDVDEVGAVDPAAAVADEQKTPGEGESDELTLTRIELAERTTDLQRLQAEFLNYKRRVDRDRELIRENATFKVLSPIIEVLDTIDRAREHEDLDPGFRAVAEQLERVVQGLGLVRFGEVGDAFDPNLHEALTHLGEDAQVEVTTCQVIAKAGYRIGDRVVRAAQVLVVDPPA